MILRYTVISHLFAGAVTISTVFQAGGRFDLHYNRVNRQAL